MTKQVVGIDVGKEKVDVGLADEKSVRVWANDEAGRAEFLPPDRFQHTARVHLWSTFSDGGNLSELR